jgi:4-aminobutyrate aminotransferase-like enzyme
MARVSKKYAPPGRMKPAPPPEVIEEAPPAPEADAPTNGHHPPAAVAMPDAAEMRRAIADNVWLHFTQMGEFAEGGRLEHPTVIVRGQGSHIWDAEGNEYIDGLAGLFCVNVGYGRS